MSHVTRRGPVKPQLNITPLIDVVFLLIVFFMIVNNIVTDEVPELQLPELVDPETHQPEGKSRVLVNIIPVHEYEPSGEKRVGPGNPEGEVLARGGEVKEISIGNQRWVITEEGALKAFQEFAAKTIRARYVSNNNQPPLIMLRADAGVYYSQVLPILNTLQQAMAEALEPEVAAETPVHLVAYMPDN